MMTQDGLMFEANFLKEGRLQALTRQQLQAQATQIRQRRWVAATSPPCPTGEAAILPCCPAEELGMVSPELPDTGQSGRAAESPDGITGLSPRRFHSKGSNA